MTTPGASDISTSIEGVRTNSALRGHPQPSPRHNEKSDLYYDLGVTLKSEPRIQYLVRSLSALLRRVQLTKLGRPVEIDGFALKNHDHWMRPSQGDPDELLCVLSRPCNAKCEFCYVHGNPPDLAVRFNQSSTERNGAEIRTRLDAFARGKALFSPTFDTEEILINPHFFDTAREIRRYSQRRIFVVTNAYLLREEFLHKLKQLEPIELSISLNLVDPTLRRTVMGANHSTPASCLRLLDEFEFRYDISVVAWPSIPIEALRETILYADRFSPYAIYVNLPGYTSWFSRTPLFDRERYWDEVVTSLRPLRNGLRNALVFTPRIFEELRYHSPLGDCHVIGVVPRSPAQAAGIQIGDVIVRIGDTAIITRAQCMGALVRLRRAGVPSITVTVRRGADHAVLTIEDAVGRSSGYRYHFPYRDMYGIQLIGGGITLGSLERLFTLIRSHRATRVLLISSPLV